MSGWPGLAALSRPAAGAWNVARHATLGRPPCPRRARTAQEVDVSLAASAATGLSPVGVGLLGFGALVALLLVTYAFRNVGKRD